MKVLDRRTAGDLTKLLIFIVVTTLATSLLVMTIGNLTFSPKNEYRARTSRGRVPSQASRGASRRSFPIPTRSRCPRRLSRNAWRRWHVSWWSSRS